MFIIYVERGISDPHSTMTNPSKIQVSGATRAEQQTLYSTFPHLFAPPDHDDWTLDVQGSQNMDVDVCAGCVLVRVDTSPYTALNRDEVRQLRERLQDLEAQSEWI